MIFRRGWVLWMFVIITTPNHLKQRVSSVYHGGWSCWSVWNVPWCSPINSARELKPDETFIWSPVLFGSKSPNPKTLYILEWNSMASHSNLEMQQGTTIQKSLWRTGLYLQLPTISQGPMVGNRCIVPFTITLTNSYCKIEQSIKWIFSNLSRLLVLFHVWELIDELLNIITLNLVKCQGKQLVCECQLTGYLGTNI